MRKEIVSAGIVLGVACELWTLVMGVTGWYKHPALMNLFWVVILIEIGVLVWALRKTAPTTAYLGQVGNGTMVAVVAAVIIFFGSLLFTSVLFPHYFEEVCAVQKEMLHNAGKTDAEIKAYLDMGASLRTPLANALLGVFGTVVTGFLASLVIGAFSRKK
jgi:hypothetical protein